MPVAVLLGVLGAFAAGITALVLPTSVSEFVCRTATICLSGAPRIGSVEPLGEDLYLVSLEGDALGPDVRAQRQMIMITTGESKSLLRTDTPPVVGAYAPTSEADTNETETIVAALTGLRPDRMLHVLSVMPGLASAGPLTGQIAQRLEVADFGTTCADFAVAAQQFEVMDIMGASYDASDRVELRLMKMTEGCGGSGQ